MSKSKSVLVTGANGYVGRHLVVALLERGFEVLAADLAFDKVDSRAIQVTTPIFGSDEIFDLQPDILIHLAWRNGFQHNADTHIGDLPAHITFIKGMIDSGVKHIAALGSMHEVGYWEGAVDENTPCNPSSMYGIAKNALRQATNTLLNEDITFQWLRGYYLTGDDSSNHSIFAKLIEAETSGKELFPLNSGKIKYDFIDIDVFANQITDVISQTEVAGIINCCSGVPMSLGERVEQFIADNHFNIRPDYGKFPDRPYDSPIIYGDNTKIKRIERDINAN